MSLFEHCPLTRRSFLAVGLSVTMAGLPSAGRAEANKATVPRSAVVSEQGGKKTYLLAFDMGR